MLRRERVDILHMHGVDFWSYLPDRAVPVLVTLHLPLHCYPPEALFPVRANTWLHCVSFAQHATRPEGAQFLEPIENGVEIPTPAGEGERRFALYLGRICPEKGAHIAIAAAKRAGIPLVIAGTVFPYPDHVKYYQEQIAPQLDDNCQFYGAADYSRKLQLLAGARCVLIPSLIEETSSLVAREALASGVPVVAFPRVALKDTIDNGVTGFIVDDVASMAEAIERCSRLSSAACRDSARQRFPIEKMFSAYLRLYQQLADNEAICTSTVR